MPLTTRSRNLDARKKEQAQRLVAQALAYQDEVIKVLEEATIVNDYTLTVVSRTFVLDNGGYDFHQHSLPVDYSEAAQDELDSLKYDLKIMDDRRKAALNQAALCRSGLAKLTALEQSALGLT